MALKRRIVEDQIDMSHYVKTACVRGGMATLANTGDFGWGMDDETNVVAYAADPSGKVPAGMLLQTSESVDVTQIPRNYQDHDTVTVNSKVAVLRKGVAITNMIDSSRSSDIAPGDDVYIGLSGLLTDEALAKYVRAGNSKFQSHVASDGFVKVAVDVN